MKRDKGKDKVNPGFLKDTDGNVFIAHDTSFDRSNRKKEKKKTEMDDESISCEK